MEDNQKHIVAQYNLSSNANSLKEILENLEKAHDKVRTDILKAYEHVRIDSTVQIEVGIKFTGKAE